MEKSNFIPDIKRNHLENSSNVIPEDIAHKIISLKGKVLMIFERPDTSLYGYIARQFTDLGHAKKVTVNDFIRFEKHS